jgi:hypothetical protein
LDRFQLAQIVMFGIETADQLIDAKGSFPDIPQQLAAGTSIGLEGFSIDGWIITFVFAAAAFEFPGSDLQTNSKPSTLAKLGLEKMSGVQPEISGFVDGLFDVLLRLGLHGRLEVADALTQAFCDFGNFFAPEKQYRNSKNHKKFRHSDGFKHRISLTLLTLLV